MAMAQDAEQIIIRPQVGPQEKMLSCGADIVIFGGGAGGGKTWGLLLEPIRYHAVKDFGATIFRRTCSDITNQGGMWDESFKLYPYLEAKPNNADLSWVFPGGAAVQFSHLQHDKDRFNYKGAQIPLLGFDQLETFLESQFWYLVSRNRSTCGVQPYIRATVNPVPVDDPVGGWVAKLLQWWWDRETGYMIPERDGLVRWLVRIDEQIVWADNPQELMASYPGCRPLSFTFIEAKLEHNKILEQKDPGYRAKLMALPKVERERLLGCNWKVKAEAGKVFDRSWFKIVEAAPAMGMRWVRYWDKAGTQGAGKRTAGVKMGRHMPTGRYFVADCTAGQWSFEQREQVIKQTAQNDGVIVKIRGEQEPGSSGKDVAGYTVKNLAGYDVRMAPSTGDKFTRSAPFSAQAEAGNVYLVAGQWVEAYLTELHNAEPGAEFLDRMDASSGAFNELAHCAIDGVPLLDRGRNDDLDDEPEDYSSGHDLERSAFSLPG